MKNNNRPFSTISYISAFLIGVILFRSFGKNWLDLESASAFLAGLIGVAVSVFVFGASKITHHSNKKDN